MMIRRPTSSAFTLTVLITVTLSLAASAPANDLSAELARVRAVTAKYHNLSQAEADGYVQDVCHVDGCHWFNWDLYDGTFDIEQPEALNYVPTKDGGWRLVAVEYVVMGTDPPQPAPEGFTGDEDAPDGDEYGWRFGTEGFPDWELSVWIWSHNPNGMFAMENPRLEEE
jgi:hypothetical protein